MNENIDNTENIEINNPNEITTEDSETKTQASEQAINWEEKYNELNDKYLRAYAEFENYKRRTAKERLELFGTASKDVMVALLPVIDDLERAQKAMENNNETDAIKEGINLVHHKFINTLQNKGLAAIKSIGEAFDVDRHEAITKIPSPSPEHSGKVIDEVEKGYTLNGTVIRYAKVVIGE